jgi:hypothetical protein
MAGGNHNHVQTINPAPQEIPGDLKYIADFLLSSSSELSLRKGNLNDSVKVDFFKGKHAANALMREVFQKKKQTQATVSSRDEAEDYLQKLLQNGLIVKVDKKAGSKELQVSPDKIFDPLDYYCWIYQGSQLWGRLMGLTLF